MFLDVELVVPAVQGRCLILVWVPLIFHSSALVTQTRHGQSV